VLLDRGPDRRDFRVDGRGERVKDEVAAGGSSWSETMREMKVIVDPRAVAVHGSLERLERARTREQSWLAVASERNEHVPPRDWRRSAQAWS
jgi:hypothetical protein